MLCIENLLLRARFVMTPAPGIYIILDGIEGCMRIYCTRHDDIHRAGTARWISSWLVQYVLIQPEIKAIQYYYYYIIWSWLYSKILTFLMYTVYVGLHWCKLTTYNPYNTTAVIINIAYRSRQDQTSWCWHTNSFLANYCCTTIVKHLYTAWLSLYLVISTNSR